MDKKIMLMKIFWVQGVVCPCPGGYMHVYDQNIQTSSSLKPLDQSNSNIKVVGCINGPGHMTKMATRAINSKNL